MQAVLPRCLNRQRAGNQLASCPLHALKMGLNPALPRSSAVQQAECCRLWVQAGQCTQHWGKWGKTPHLPVRQTRPPGDSHTLPPTPSISSSP